jgi:drug/metabolite transporter (DMT)-like permease
MEAIIRKNPKLWMVAFYLFFVAGFLFVKPSIAFGEQGRVRPFGVGKRECTVFPVWWWMFIFAVLSYTLVAFLLNYDF